MLTSTGQRSIFRSALNEAGCWSSGTVPQAALRVEFYPFEQANRIIRYTVETDAESFTRRRSLLKLPVARVASVREKGRADERSFRSKNRKHE